jgi:hypothetical protein
MSDETITLPLDVVMRWQDSWAGLRPGKVLPIADALYDAIDAAFWKPERGVHYKASEHWPTEKCVLEWFPEDTVPCWAASYPERWSGGREHIWMLQPPAPAYDPSEDDS